MAAQQETPVNEALQHMLLAMRNSVYFGPEDFKAVQAEMTRQAAEDPEEAQLREMIDQRERLLVSFDTQFGLASRCRDLFVHFAHGLENMQLALDRMVRARKAQQEAHISYA
jgi:hypothetical protein